MPPATAFGAVFLFEACLFLAASVMAAHIMRGAATARPGALIPGE